MQQNYINHIALVLDASGSMQSNAKDVVKVAGNQIHHLAQRSKELDQETRITVYSFSNDVKCLVYDKDVLRLPSIANLYKIQDMTALIDATMKALEDLSHTAQLYGEHAFLTYVLTDGQENYSRKFKAADLELKLKTLPDHWTTAVFVPDQRGVHEAKKFGFPKENVAIWNPSEGMKEVGETIRKATDNFMTLRSQGIRGSKNLFSLDTSNLKTKLDGVGDLVKLHAGQFRLLDVKEGAVIAPFVEEKLKRPYRMGEAYYELMKREAIQPQKKIALFHTKDHCVYEGKSARSILGLPDYEVKVNPADHSLYKIFVQSTSVNRKLPAGTKLLVMS